MPEPFLQNDLTALYLGDLREVLPGLPANSIDCVCTDPPCGLGFVEKDWGDDVPGPEYWRTIARVCKRGAFLMAFGGPRTHHRLACAIEDAGWEVRDCLMWLVGQGMPKCGDIGKLIDKAKGAKREVVGTKLGRPGYCLADHGRTNEVYPVAETTVRGVQTAVVTGTLAQWREAVKRESSPKVAATVRHGFNRIYAQFCAQGLDVWASSTFVRPPTRFFWKTGFGALNSSSFAHLSYESLSSLHFAMPEPFFQSDLTTLYHDDLRDVLGRPGYSLADHGRTSEVYPVAETTVRGIQAAVVTGTLAQWREAVKAGSNPKVAATVRHGFNRIHGQFCAQGLNVWSDCSTRPAADQIFLENRFWRSKFAGFCPSLL